MSESNRERLTKLKLLLAQELASAKPSHNYIEDLERSIERLEKRLPDYMMVS